MSFVAQHDGGRCRACGRMLWRGDLVDRVGYKAYEHIDCERPQATDDRTRRRPTDAPPIR